MHNFASFVIHLHLLFCVTIIHKYIYLRNKVISQLISKFINSNRLASQHFAILLFQLSHSSSTSTRCRLICRYMHTFDVRQIFNRFQSHNHLNSCTIRVSYDITRTHQSIFSVHFRHYQWHIFVHTEGT